MKFNFSTHGHATSFACITTPILPNQALEFFELNSTPSPFLLITTPLPILATNFHEP
jgi:hypothetical protein